MMLVLPLLFLSSHSHFLLFLVLLLSYSCYSSSSHTHTLSFSLARSLSLPHSLQDITGNITLHDPWDYDDYAPIAVWPYSKFLTLWNYTETDSPRNNPFMGAAIYPWYISVEVTDNATDANSVSLILMFLLLYSDCVVLRSFFFTSIWSSLLSSLLLLLLLLSPFGIRVSSHILRYLTFTITCFSSSFPFLISPPSTFQKIVTAEVQYPCFPPFNCTEFVATNVQVSIALPDVSPLLLLSLSSPQFSLSLFSSVLNFRTVLFPFPNHKEFSTPL
jgi:hypothetical protein